MKEITLQWQRLMEDGQTCPRCSDTGQAVRQAADTLRTALAPLGIGLRLEEGELASDEFAHAPLESNRILLQGRTLEDWVGATTGHSPCCEVCGPNDCRTVTVDGTTYEAIPADLIIRAGLLAASTLLSEPRATEPCCSPRTGLPVVQAGGGCC